MIIEQDNFSKGLDLVSQDTQIDSSGYLWLINARQRYGAIEPNFKPTLLDAPTGKKQGIIAVGNITLLFVAGLAYYKFYNSTTWHNITGFSMDATVDQYYTCAIPASSLDYVRKLNTSGNITDDLILSTNFRPQGSPAGVIVQDGVTQPFFLTFNEVTQTFLCRPLKTYLQWQNSPTGQEYVPIGLNMMFLDPILFIVAPDRLSCYRSVSGQPLNFMVNIDINGNKASTEAIGGAASMAFAFDYDPITCIKPINLQNSFLYCTRQMTRVITLDTVNTIFNEPRFYRTASINVGTLNQYSTLDILGDEAIINYEGITTFNAVQSTKFQGRNSPFSRQIGKLIRDIKQEDSICVGFNNYAIFNVDTILGNILAVYDTLSQTWVAIDITKVSKIKKFASIDIIGETRLYAITQYDELYQMYDETASVEMPILYTRAYTVSPYGMDNAIQNVSVATEIKSDRMDLLFQNGTIEGFVSVQEIVDDAASTTLKKALGDFSNNIPFPVIPPVMPIGNPQVERITFNFKDFVKGYKVAYLIRWDTDAKLKGIRIITSDINAPVGTKQQERIYRSTYQVSPP